MIPELSPWRTFDPGLLIVAREHDSLRSRDDERLQAGLADHQPDDDQHGREGRETERKPETPQTVVAGRQAHGSLGRVTGDVAHSHLHPHNRQPEEAHDDVERETQGNPPVEQRIAA